MFRIKLPLTITFFVITFFIFAGSSATAQKSVTKFPTLGCCECLGGTNTLDLSTVSANGWTVNNNPVAFPTSIHPAWNLPTGSANWVSTNMGGANYPGISGPLMYDYRLRFVVPECTVNQKIVLTGKYGADDTVKVYLDSVSTANLISQCGGIGWCFNTPQNPPPPLNVPILPGTHDLILQVWNGSSGPSGMFVNAKLTGTCTKEPIKPKKE